MKKLLFVALMIVGLQGLGAGKASADIKDKCTYSHPVARAGTSTDKGGGLYRIAQDFAEVRAEPGSYCPLHVEFTVQGKLLAEWVLKIISDTEVTAAFQQQVSHEDPANLGNRDWQFFLSGRKTAGFGVKGYLQYFGWALSLQYGNGDINTPQFDIRARIGVTQDVDYNDIAKMDYVLTGLMTPGYLALLLDTPFGPAIAIIVPR